MRPFCFQSLAERVRLARHHGRAPLRARSIAAVPLIVAALGLAVGLSGCSTQRLLAGAVADQLAGQDSAPEDDLELVRDAAPFFLKFGESVLAQAPDHEALAQTLAAGFVRYAWAFVAFEADRIESRDSAAAARLRKRAVRLYERAERHAMRALEFHYPGLRKTLAEATPGEERLRLDPRHAGLAYWAAAAWGARIALSKDDAEAIADLPAAARLVSRVTACCAAWGDGAAASLAASFEAGRPGGRRADAQAWFDRAEQYSGGRVAAIPIARAEALAQSADDRAEFERLIRQAIEIADRHPGTENRIMSERARWLLETIDDRF